MDSPAATLDSFRTPARILVPKLVNSRDGWKRKAAERKRRLKAAAVKVRDLQASRQLWRDRHDDARRRADDAEGQLLLARAQLTHARAEAERLRLDAEKKAPPR